MSGQILVELTKEKCQTGGNYVLVVIGNMIIPRIGGNF